VGDGLVLDLDFAKPTVYNGSGTVVTDSRLNGIEGSINGASFINPRTHRSAFDFDGSNDTILLTNPIPGEYRTILVWWFQKETITGDSGGPGSIISAADNDALWIGGFTSSFSGETINLFDSSSSGISILTDTVTQGWHNLIFTFSGQSPYYDKAWLDGIERTVNFRNGVGASLFANKFREIGARSLANNQYSSATIAAIKLYNKSFTNEEAFQNFEATRWRFGV